MAFQKFYNENVIILDIPNAILWTFIILTCDYKSEPKIFYVLHISLEAKKKCTHIYRKFYNLMKETWWPQCKFIIPQTKTTLNKEPNPSSW